MNLNWAITLQKQLKTCCAKGKGAVYHSAVTRWFNRFHSVCKNPNNQVRSGRSKTKDSETMLRAIESNPVGSARAQHLIVQCGSSPWQKQHGAVTLCLMLPKYCKTFDSL